MLENKITEDDKITLKMKRKYLMNIKRNYNKNYKKSIASSTFFTGSLHKPS